MKSLMLILSFIFLSVTSQLEASCTFKSYIKNITSLSGPMTVALKHLNLLKNPIVKGISVFNPISKEDFSGKRMPGGIFLGRDSFAEFSGGIIFFDESRELSKILTPMNSVQGIEIKTRGLTPLQVTHSLIKELKFHTKDCEKEFGEFVSKTQKLEQELQEKMKKIAVLYFLGEFRNGRNPEMIIANDGIVKWLVEKKMITTYPSELAYVNWSPKILSTLPKNILKVGVKDSGATMVKKITKGNGFMNFEYPGSLVPGISQLEAWNYLAAAP